MQFPYNGPPPVGGTFEETDMKKLQVGLSTGCFYKSNITEHIDAIIDRGFDLLEISSSASHIDIYDEKSLWDLAGHLGDRGAKVLSLHAPFAREIDITSTDDEERRYSQETILQSLKAASAVGSDYFVLHPWPEKEFPRESREKHKRRENAEEYIRILARRCREYGVVLALENMQPQLLISPLKDLLWIRHETEEAHVGACFDTGHAFLGHSLDFALKELAGHIVMAHVSDNWGQKDDHLPPGRGAVDWKSFVSELLRQGFSGSFIIELEDREDLRRSVVLDDAWEGAEFLRKVIREAQSRY